MNTTIAVLIFGLVVVAVVTLLLWRSQTRGGSGQASFSFGELFKATVKLEPQNAARAEEALRLAAKQRGEPPDRSHSVRTDQAAIRLARVLWVDDQPDNNLYETVALENLGRFVTKATSTEAGLFYLSQLDFALAITDLRRAGNENAGEDFIRRTRAAGHLLPVVVYTVQASRKRDRLLAAGAQAVVDMPGDLIRKIDNLIAHGVTATSKV